MKLLNFVSAAVLAMTATVANADVYREGEVLLSEPLYITKTYETPHEVCKKVEVPIYEDRISKGHDDVGAFVGGAVIGGLIGNAIDSSGGAGIGAIIGGALANEGQKKNHRESVVVGYRKETHCTEEYRSWQKQSITGYRTVVEIFELDRYRFEFVSDREYRPGERVKVRVDLNPKVVR